MKGVKRMKIQFMMRLAMILGIGVALGCGKAQVSQSDKLNVVATTTMLTDLAEVIGGEEVEVKGLMGPGVDPHLYKAASSDLRDLTQAKVIFYNGLYLEGKISDVLHKMGDKAHAVAEVIPHDLLQHPAEFEGHPDPHVWGDVSLWIQCIDSVVKGLSQTRPEKAEFFAERGQAYRETLKELDAWVRARIDTVPDTDRLLFTSHDAFNYFGRTYGFEVIGVQGISTVSEAGLGDVSKSIELIRERGIKAVFAESSVSPVTIQRISEDSGAVVGGELYSDAMGLPGDVVTLHGESYDRGTYIGMIKHNVNTIVDALSGKSRGSHEH